MALGSRVTLETCNRLNGMGMLMQIDDSPILSRSANHLSYILQTREEVWPPSVHGIDKSPLSDRICPAPTIPLTFYKSPTQMKPTDYDPQECLYPLRMRLVSQGQTTMTEGYSPTQSTRPRGPSRRRTLRSSGLSRNEAPYHTHSHRHSGQRRMREMIEHVGRSGSRCHPREQRAV